MVKHIEEMVNDINQVPKLDISKTKKFDFSEDVL